MPSPDRIVKIRSLIAKFLTQPGRPASQWASLLGLLSSSEKLVPLGRLHMRSLQFTQKKHWLPHLDSVMTVIPLSDQNRLDLIWWSDPSHLMLGAPLQPPSPDALLFTDASTEGWGAHWDDLEISGLLLRRICTSIIWSCWPFFWLFSSGPVNWLISMF